jgi:N-acetylglucosamine-6-phosphate deacetylase
MTSLRVCGGDIDIHVEHSRIAAIAPADGRARTVTLDADGCSVLPGFVDVQVNGAVGVDLTTQPERIGEVAAFLPQTGVTSFMPTVISSPLDDIGAAVATMHRWAQSAHDPMCARSLGVHIEGPFLNPARSGAHPRQHLRPPSIDAVTGWSRGAGVAMVTIAPELPGAFPLIESLVRRGVVVCAGHTDADQQIMADARSVGVRGVTHLFNAMGAMSARSPGAAGWTLADDTLIAGLIVDGLHVDAVMVRLAWRTLGPTRIALVTDSMAALGLTHGTYVIGDSSVVVDATGARTSTGVLAGSVLRFDEGVRALMAHTGCSLDDASSAASGTPARLAARDDIGDLAAGRLADIVLLDEECRVVATVVGGRVVWDPQGRQEVTSWRS